MDAMTPRRCHEMSQTSINIFAHAEHRLTAEDGLWTFLPGIMPDLPLPLADRAASAAAGGLLSALTLHPLDVIKTRQQAGAARVSAAAQGLSIVRHEGISALWIGLRPAMAFSVPSTMLYLVAYESLRDNIARQWPTAAEWAPLVAGGAAKGLSGFAFAPVELMRTRLLAATAASAPSHDGLVTRTMAFARQHGVRSLWRGVSISLARDVPFSCLYFSAYERLRYAYLQRSAQNQQ
jgi:solute carrier family 25 protein 39/40